MKEFEAVITIDIPVLLTAENKNDALQQVVATDKAYLTKRIQNMDCIQIRVPYIKELSEEKKSKSKDRIQCTRYTFRFRFKPYRSL